MLQINKDSSKHGGILSRSDKAFFVSFNDFINVINRQRSIVAVLFSCFMVLGFLYYLVTPPSFTATGTLVVDKRKVQLFQNESVLSGIDVDTATVQTEVEVLKSDSLSLAVIRKLHLADDPEFTGPSVEPVGRLIGLITGLFARQKRNSEFEREASALLKFDKRRKISRIGLTYVMDIDFTSHDPDKAARIVNALADAYIDDQLNAKYQAARRASAWLQERLIELRTQANAGEQAVVDFKGKNNIVDTGGGRLVNEQQLTEINSQLVLARAATAEAKARLDRINAVMKEDPADASVADALKSEVIIKLRGQYLEIAQREALWSKKYGDGHLAAITLRTQMEELRRSIKDEMGKIAETYKSDYEIALTRQQSLEKSLANVVSESQTTGQAQVKLRELESSAETSRTLYDSFLQRYMEAVQQQSVPISEARLVSPAMRPLKRSSPKWWLVLLVSAGGGGLLSAAAAYFCEARDGTLRTSRQVEEALNAACLAMVPTFQPPREPVGTKVPRNAPPARENRLRYAVNAPFSRYAEAIRSVKVAADLGGVLKSHRVIGVTSTLPNEGKSTIAANLAHLIADAGGSVVLVDADLRNPSLSRRFAPNALGLMGAVMGYVSPSEAIVPIPSSTLHFMPAGARARLPHTSELLASPALKSCADALRGRYDYVVVDLSPVIPVVDVRATGHFIDTYVYVVEWGKTKIEAIEQGLAEAQNVMDHLLGIVLNKVDLSVQARYEPYRGSAYQSKHYAKYGYTE